MSADFDGLTCPCWWGLDSRGGVVAPGRPPPLLFPRRRRRLPQRLVRLGHGRPAPVRAVLAATSGAGGQRQGREGAVRGVLALSPRGRAAGHAGRGEDRPAVGGGRLLRRL